MTPNPAISLKRASTEIPPENQPATRLRTSARVSSTPVSRNLPSLLIASAIGEQRAVATVPSRLYVPLPQQTLGPFCLCVRCPPPQRRQREPRNGNADSCGTPMGRQRGRAVPGNRIPAKPRCRSGSNRIAPSREYRHNETPQSRAALAEVGKRRHSRHFLSKQPRQNQPVTGPLPKRPPAQPIRYVPKPKKTALLQPTGLRVLDGTKKVLDSSVSGSSKTSSVGLYLSAMNWLFAEAPAPPSGVILLTTRL